MVKMTTKQKRIRNPVETRAKLLKATIDLVTEKGATALSLKEAAKLAGVSRSIAYPHFADRDELLREANSWVSDQLQEGLQNYDSGASFDDRTLLTTKLVLEHPEATKQVIQAANDGERYRPSASVI